jgi:hypothetical protein
MARQRLLLLLVVAAIVGFALWQWRHDLARAPASLLALDPAAVTRISLRIGHTPVEHYARRDGHWWRTDGTPMRADDGRLDQLADTAAARAMGWRPASDFEPEKIGLAPPAAVLTLDDQVIEFGETSVTGPQRYVRVGDRMAMVSLGTMPRTPRDEAVKAP